MSTLTRRFVPCDSYGNCHQNMTSIIVVIVILIVLKICFWIALCTWLARRRRRKERVAYTGGYDNQPVYVNMPLQDHLVPQGPPPPPTYTGGQMSPERKIGQGQMV